MARSDSGSASPSPSPSPSPILTPPIHLTYMDDYLATKQYHALNTKIEPINTREIREMRGDENGNQQVSAKEWKRLETMYQRLHQVIQDQQQAVNKIQKGLKHAVTKSHLELIMSQKASLSDVHHHMISVRAELSSELANKANRSEIETIMQGKATTSQMEALQTELNNLKSIYRVGSIPEYLLDVMNDNQLQDTIKSIATAFQYHSGQGQTQTQTQSQSQSQPQSQKLEGQPLVSSIEQTEGIPVEGVFQYDPYADPKTMSHSIINTADSGLPSAPPMPSLIERRPNIASDDEIRTLRSQIDALELAVDMATSRGDLKGVMAKCTQQFEQTLEQKINKLYDELNDVKGSYGRTYREIEDLVRIARANDSYGDGNREQIASLRKTVDSLQKELGGMDTSTTYSKNVYDRILPQAENVQNKVEEMMKMLAKQHADKQWLMSQISQDRLTSEADLAYLQKSVSELEHSLKSSSHSYGKQIKLAMEQQQQMINKIESWRESMEQQMQVLNEMCTTQGATLTSLLQPIAIQLQQLSSENDQFGLEISRYQQDYQKLVSGYHRLAHEAPQLPFEHQYPMPTPAVTSAISPSASASASPSSSRPMSAYKQHDMDEKQNDDIHQHQDRPPSASTSASVSNPTYDAYREILADLQRSRPSSAIHIPSYARHTSITSRPTSPHSHTIRPASSQSLTHSCRSSSRLSQHTSPPSSHSSSRATSATRIRDRDRRASVAERQQQQYQQQQLEELRQRLAMAPSPDIPDLPSPIRPVQARNPHSHSHSHSHRPSLVETLSTLTPASPPPLPTPALWESSATRSRSRSYASRLVRTAGDYFTPRRR